MGFLDIFRTKAPQPQQPYFVLKYTGSSLIMIPGNSQAYYQEGWLNNSTIYAIVRKVAEKAAQVPHYQFDTRKAKNSELTEYKALRSNYDPKAQLEAKRLAKKAFDEITNTNDPINLLLANPNPGMTYSQFTEFVLINKMIYGGCPVYANKGVVGNDVLALYPFNSHWLQIEPDQTLMKIKRARLLVDYTGFDMKVDCLFMVKYVDPEIKIDGTHLFGHSPIQSGLREVQKDNETTKASLFLMQNKGISGFFKPQDVETSRAMQAAPGGPSAIRQSLDDLLKRNEGATDKPFTPLAVEYVSFGMDAQALQLVEQAIANEEKLANLYDFPHPLLNGKAATMDNVKSATKYLVTNTISGHIKSLEEMWQFVCIASGKPERMVVFDIMSMPELQEDIQRYADWMAKSGLFTTNESREALKYERNPEPMADQILVAGNLMPLSDLGGESGTL
jgi:HK97 family phage portal protein